MTGQSPYLLLDVRYAGGGLVRPELAGIPGGMSIRAVDPAQATVKLVTSAAELTIAAEAVTGVLKLARILALSLAWL
ncbi:MAG: hypothetical protein LC749_15940 [Actinobacteria bacterium]|nr:hypothetical protein [Actinomycetota bacterium]